MSTSPESGDSSKLTIVAFGDSITEGTYGGATTGQSYPALLEKMLLQQQVIARVFNKGIPGETAPEALLRLQRDVIDLNPDIVLIMYGANDAYIPPGFDRPAVSAGVFSKAIEEIVDNLLELSIQTILMTTTPISGLDFFGEGDDGFVETNTISLESHLKEVRKIANKKQILLIDHYSVWRQLDKTEGIIKPYLPDGVHPNANGNNLLAVTTFNALVDEIRK